MTFRKQDDWELVAFSVLSWWERITEETTNLAPVCSSDSSVINVHAVTGKNGLKKQSDDTKLTKNKENPYIIIKD